MILDDTTQGTNGWVVSDSGVGIVLSSRVRLARNLRGLPFPDRASADVRRRVCSEIRDACLRTHSLGSAAFFDMGELDALEKSILKERRMISIELAARGAGSGLLVAKDGGVALMANEEDHLRLQAIVAGDDVYTAWRTVDALDSELEAFVDYAYTSRWGYLTACPSNVGTGLRASVMMHLPALDMLNEAEAVVRGLTRIGLAVRGVFGEGTQASGNMYQISNQSTLGRKEKDIVDNLVELVREVARHETNARARLMEGRRTLAGDRIARALGILTHARMVSSGEMAELLSTARLGLEFGMLKGIGVAAVNELLLAMQPGHLQKTAGRKLGSAERDAMRADVARNRFAGVELMVDGS